VKRERGPEPGSLYAVFKMSRLALLGRRFSGSGGALKVDQRLRTGVLDQRGNAVANAIYSVIVLVDHFGQDIAAAVGFVPIEAKFLRGVHARGASTTSGSAARLSPSSLGYPTALR